MKSTFWQTKNRGNLKHALATSIIGTGNATGRVEQPCREFRTLSLLSREMPADQPCQTGRRIVDRSARRLVELAVHPAQQRMKCVLRRFGLARQIDNGRAVGHGPFEKLLRQPRFSDAGFAANEQGPPSTIEGTRPGLLQTSKLPFTPDEWRKAIAHRLETPLMRPATEHPEEGKCRVVAAETPVAQRLAFEVLLHQVIGWQGQGKGAARRQLREDHRDAGNLA